jgi:hypothetical protein
LSDSFNTSENRRLLVDLLIDAGVGDLVGHSRLEGFIAGGEDIPLDTLDVDSLALMEMGITIEDVFDASLSPHALSKLKTLGEVWAAVLSERGASGK